MMRSLHVITSDARRGAETFAIGLCAQLETQHHVARTVALQPSDEPMSLGVPALGRSRRSVQTLAGLRKAAANADVVVAHGSSTLEACVFALAGTAVPFVYRNIGDPGFWIEGGWRRRWVGLSLRRATRVAALWPEAASRIATLHRVPRDRIDVIPNAVDESRFALAGAEERRRLRAALGVDRRVPCFATVGALSFEKDVATAIAATASVDGAILLIAGTGPLREELERLARRVAPGRVRFLEQVEDLRPVYAAADLLLLPSRSEGMPAVILEAGLVGTATVSTSVGAVPAMIDDGVTGFVSGPPDADRFVFRVVEAMPSASEVGARAAETLRGPYSMERVADQWSQTLEAAVGRGRRATTNGRGLSRRR